MSHGFIKLPRSLNSDPLWNQLSLEHQHIFLKLVFLACYNETPFDDHGELFNLQPGEVCITHRALMDICHKTIKRHDIESAYLKLKLYRFIRQEVRHTKSIITITHKDTYDLIINKSQTESQTKSRQDPDRKEERKEHKEIKLHPKADEVASFLLKSIQKTKPDIKLPNLQKWSQEINRMLTIDNRSEESVKKIIDWIPSDEFWCNNILSAAKLREKFDQLELHKNKKVKLEIIPISQEHNPSEEQLRFMKESREYHERLKMEKGE